MGNSKEALSVLINRLGDMEEAVEFVSLQNDVELWQELIKLCLDKPEMVGMLLELTVGNLDPLHIVNMVPDGLEIPRLRHRLVKIITDYRTETSLRHGCNDILKTDCINLLIKYYKEARHAVYLSNEDDEARAKRDSNRVNDSSFGRGLSLKNVELKSKTRGGRRCCMCLDPFSIQGVSVVIFFCCHAYHMTCYTDSSSSLSIDEETQLSDHDEYDDSEEKDVPYLAPRMRCILCTNAAR
ncbi:Vacuolar protein sorting-associated protein 41 [Dionaea muscipula]